MKTISTDSIKATNESLAVAIGKAVLAALETLDTVDVERGDEMGDDQWSELGAYLARRGVTLGGTVASR